MTANSPQLNLPYIQPGQAQKHVTHNEALQVLDVVTQLSVKSSDLQAPPTSVADGSRFVIATPASGLWTGQDGHVAQYSQGQWLFIPPQVGWRAYDEATATDIIYDGTNWTSASAEAVASLGINADADLYNRLVVAADAVLLNHDGAGHQVKVNKATVTDTASLLFQTDYSGRAEMGTAGSDDFAIKVSQDGTAWFNALTIDAATGAVQMPFTPLKEVLSAPRTYFVDGTAGDDANTGLAAGSAFATLDAAMTALRAVDASGHDITVQLADGTYTLPQAIDVQNSPGNVGTLVFAGNDNTPSNVTITSPNSVFRVAQTSVRLQGLKLENTSNNDAALLLNPFSSATLDNVVFGDAAIHIECINANLECSTNYVIEGNAEYHVRMTKCATMDLDFSTVTLQNTPAFSGAFIRCQGCVYAELRAVTFTGAATGRRYQVYHNAAIQTANGGEEYLPGDIAGVASYGGRYS